MLKQYVQEILPETDACHNSGRVASVLDNQGQGHPFAWDYDQKLSLYDARIEDPLGKLIKIWSNKKCQGLLTLSSSVEKGTGG